MTARPRKSRAVGGRQEGAELPAVIRPARDQNFARGIRRKRAAPAARTCAWPMSRRRAAPAPKREPEVAVVGAGSDHLRAHERGAVLAHPRDPALLAAIVLHACPHEGQARPVVLGVPLEHLELVPRAQTSQGGVALLLGGRAGRGELRLLEDLADGAALLQEDAAAVAHERHPALRPVLDGAAPQARDALVILVGPLLHLDHLVDLKLPHRLGASHGLLGGHGYLLDDVIVR
mmetsp:Transcript_62338/g.162002  ORF Transcript_62338/g.162002 Transcript_62338/m.162002 type:complete len:233 (-) Transcript_62338:685-1383(-)